MNAHRRCLLLVLAIALAVTADAGLAQAAPGKDDAAVLVTGASSGIGLKIAQTLSANGHFVFAGARSDDDIEALNEMPNVQAVRLDVTVPADIEAAVAAVTASGRPLAGIVNNAGVAMVGPLAETPVEDLQFVFDVNVYGPYRVTRAFMPMLLKSHGRVVNMSSISGILGPGFLGHYAMSKRAMETYTDSLAAEVGPLGVWVSAVEPGNYHSNIGLGIRRQFENSELDVEKSLYRDRLKFMLNMADDRTQFDEPDEVAAAVSRALFDDVPQRRYLVTPDRRSAEITLGKLLEELVQLNEGHKYSVDRDTLVHMLDEALEHNRLTPGR